MTNVVKYRSLRISLTFKIHLKTLATVEYYLPVNVSIAKVTIDLGGQQSHYVPITRPTIKMVFRVGTDLPACWQQGRWVDPRRVMHHPYHL